MASNDVANPEPFLMLIAVFAAALSLAQVPQDSVRPAQPEALNVFLDCQAQGCDTDFFRTNITFVNYVRFQQDAALYVLVTGQQAGAGGRQATLYFIGQRHLAGRQDTLTFASSVNDTPDEVRQGLQRTLMIGLMRYVASTPAAARITISYSAPDSTAGGAQRPHDRWNAWVFRVSLNGFTFGESKQNYRNLYSFVNASRTTERWRMGGSAYYDDNRDEFTYPVPDSINAITYHDTTVVSTSHANGADLFIVRSIGKRWAVGAFANYNKSTYSNLRRQFKISPAIEFDVFPYSEFTRRRIVFTYSIGLAAREYAESTLYFKLEENLVNHALDASLRYQQRWGQAGLSMSWSQYLHDLSKNRLRLSANTELRLVRGLSLRLRGSYSWIRDQLSLPAESTDPTEVLLRRRQLATNYRYDGSIGLSYTFGSTYNNVVNPRMEDFGDCCE